jgi:PhnB protein
MKANAYLHFDGNCEAAFRFYEQRLGGKIETMMRYEGTPAADNMPPEKQAQVLHASLSIGGTVLMGSDTPPGHFSPPKGFALSLTAEDGAEAERLFAALSDGGKVEMPMGQTFFAHRFGMAADRFGVPWMVICERPPS